MRSTVFFFFGRTYQNGLLLPLKLLFIYKYFDDIIIAIGDHMVKTKINRFILINKKNPSQQRETG